MKRLPKGYGSVHKLSGSRRKPYVARVTVDTLPNGRPAYKYLGYYETKKEALNALADYNKNPYDVDEATATLADMWEIFQFRRFNEISASGRNIYKAAWNHLAPVQDKRVKDLRTYQLQAVLDNLDKGWQTKSHVQTLLHQLFNIAMELDIVPKNYASFLKLGTKPPSTKHTAFSEAEIQKLFDSVSRYPWADTVLITIYSGLRPSELLSIRTEDVHLEERYMVGGMKTEAGRGRVIPIHPRVLPFIQARYSPENAFLVQEFGKPVPYHRYRAHFKDLMETLGMSHLPHDGRHTFASRADTAGVNKMAVKLIMGHRSSDLTERVYTHKAISELIEAIALIK